LVDRLAEKLYDWPRDIVRQIHDAGMDEQVIRNHQRRVVAAISSDTNQTFRILDTCRIENGGILQMPATLKAGAMQRRTGYGITAFVPAAGASSRYLAPLIPIMEAARLKNVSACREALDSLQNSGAMTCPMPQSVKSLLSVLQSSNGDISTRLFEDVVREIDAPKALYPAVLDGDTFLALKRLEHKSFGGISGEIFICPPGRIGDFSFEASKISSPIGAKFIEQDLSLATLRFDANGRVATDASGRVSPVPAGHGALLPLLAKVPSMFPGCRAVFIRNIDNVCGNAADVLQVTRQFIDLFSESLWLLDQLRGASQQQDSQGVEQFSAAFLELWGFEVGSSLRSVDVLMTKLFHTRQTNDFKDLSRVLARPLIQMGQVPNSASDVGGTCVFTEFDGLREKLCLELPHATESDRRVFLENSQKATHFNPVFVLAEIPNEDAMRAWQDHPFWLIAKKSWQGRDVFYQESILYEMLGCSRYANAMFVEVARSVFNPHKSLKDADKKRLNDWIKV
jgi:hypothetical protein